MAGRQSYSLQGALWLAGSHIAYRGAQMFPVMANTSSEQVQLDAAGPKVSCNETDTRWSCSDITFGSKTIGVIPGENQNQAPEVRAFF